MLNPNALVAVVLRLQPSLEGAPVEVLRIEGGVSIELEGGRRARLDPANHHSAGYMQVLEGLRKLASPVYLELDPTTSFVTRLLIPYVARVVGVRASKEGGLEVELVPSHAVHFLQRSHADYEELEAQLRAALDSEKTFAVTEDDAHNIIDVRAYTPSPGSPEVLHRPFLAAPRAIEKLPSWTNRIWYWCGWPWWWWWRCGCISATHAQQVFDAMKATSCNPLTVPAPCIPFLYPDDGCWARAHEMCRLMINLGLTPKKVWIQGSLYVATRNNPNCYVRWGWHVAPTLCVRRWWFFWSETMVIDPSLFDTPVSESNWKLKQSDPNATLTPTDASIYYWGSVTDPNYTKTDYYLNVYRLMLHNRSIAVYGPPPYSNCP